MALLGKLDVNCLPPGEKHPTVRPGRAVQFGPSLRKCLRDGPQVPYLGTPRKSMHATFGADRRSLQGPGSA